MFKLIIIKTIRMSKLEVYEFTKRKDVAFTLVEIQDILNLTGSVKVCTGQLAGCEAAVHAINQLFRGNIRLRFD